MGCNCQSGGTKPSNPFAQNRQTVPPPATFSSQESYLGQTSGIYIPQTPATVFPSLSESVQSTDFSVNNGEKATLFSAAENVPDWTAVEMASTSQTAFQAMEAKTGSSSVAMGSSADVAESLAVETSHVVTTITDETQPAAVLSEPQLLYPGGSP